MKNKIILTFSFLFIFAEISWAKNFTIAGQNFPPFNWEENKIITGGMTDIMTEACKELKHTCKFEIIPLARALKLLEDGELDAVMTLIPNPEKMAYFSYSPPMSATKVSIMANKKSNFPKLKNINDLAGWTVAGIRSSVILKNVQKQLGTKATIREEVDNNTLVQRLNNNQYGNKAVVVGSEDVLNYFTTKENANIEPIYNIEENEFTVAFSKKKITAEEIEGFNKAISELKKNGTIKKILAKYNLRTK